MTVKDPPVTEEAVAFQLKFRLRHDFNFPKILTPIQEKSLTGINSSRTSIFTVGLSLLTCRLLYRMHCNTIAF